MSEALEDLKDKNPTSPAPGQRLGSQDNGNGRHPAEAAPSITTEGCGPEPAGSGSEYMEVVCIHLRRDVDSAAVPVLLLRRWLKGGEIAVVVQRIRSEMARLSPTRTPLSEPFALAREAIDLTSESSPSTVPFCEVEDGATYLVTSCRQQSEVGSFPGLNYKTLVPLVGINKAALSKAETCRLWVLLKSLDQPDRPSIKLSIRSAKEFLLARLDTHQIFLTTVIARFVDRCDDPEALVNLLAVLSDVLFRRIQGGLLESTEHLVVTTPYLCACVHRKVPPAFRKRVWQIVEIWDQRKDVFPADLRRAARQQIVLHGENEEGTEAAQVTFTVPRGMLKEPLFPNPLPQGVERGLRGAVRARREAPLRGGRHRGGRHCAV
eukprot:RCo046970